MRVRGRGRGRGGGGQLKHYAIFKSKLMGRGFRRLLVRQTNGQSPSLFADIVCSNIENSLLRNIMSGETDR